MDTTIVIASCNEGECLRRTIASCHEEIAAGAQIVVVDDASTDGSTAFLGPGASAIRLVHLAERTGVSRAKHLGAELAHTKNLLFLDAHCKPERGAILRLVRDLESFAGEAILTPAITDLDISSWRNVPDIIGHGYQVDLETLETSWMRLEDMARWGEHYATPSLIGCCLALRRETYLRLHGFDVHMAQWGIEDVDLGLRAWLSGVPVLHDPKARIGHRFQSVFSGYVVSNEHVVANQIRLAYKSFPDGVFADWCARKRVAVGGDAWEAARMLFDASFASALKERAYLARTSQHDIWWYCERFGQKWPFDLRFILNGASYDLPVGPDSLQQCAGRLRYEGEAHAPHYLSADGDPTFSVRFSRHAGGEVRLDEILFRSNSSPICRVYCAIVCHLTQGEKVTKARQLTVDRLLSSAKDLPQNRQDAARVIEEFRRGLSAL